MCKRVDIEWKNGTSINIDVINEFEKKFSIKFPESYRVIASKHNGGYPEPSRINYEANYNEQKYDISLDSKDNLLNENDYLGKISSIDTSVSVNPPEKPKHFDDLNRLLEGKGL